MIVIDASTAARELSARAVAAKKRRKLDYSLASIQSKRSSISFWRRPKNGYPKHLDIPDGPPPAETDPPSLFGSRREIDGGIVSDDMYRDLAGSQARDVLAEGGAEAYAAACPCAIGGIRLNLRGRGFKSSAKCRPSMARRSGSRCSRARPC